MRQKALKIHTHKREVANETPAYTTRGVYDDRLKRVHAKLEEERFLNSILEREKRLERLRKAMAATKARMVRDRGRFLLSRVFRSS